MFPATKGGESPAFPKAVQPTAGKWNNKAFSFMEEARRLAQIPIGIHERRAFLLLQIQHNQNYYTSCTVKKQPPFVIKISGYADDI